MLDFVNSLSAVSESDCLIEGSQKDNISHFILRLLLATDQETSEFIVRAETQLFQFRFSCMTEDEIYRLLKSVQKHVYHAEHPNPATYNFNNVRHVVYTLLAIKESAHTWKNVAHRYMQEKNTEWFHLPFQAVLSLVAKRRVQLKEGWAFVSYDDLEVVLTSVFESMLKLSLKKTREIRESALQDIRMKRLANLLKSVYRAQVPISLEWNNLPSLSHDHVDQLESLFPLCMSNLHQTLRTAHRLKHSDRIQYSLFLKEVGMPVHQSIKFWKQEYSQSSSVPGTCLHSWQKDECRYTYSIRHLYGLEGARRNYRGHCCTSLQKRQLGPSEQGGCPFVHFDNHHLGNLLTTNQIGQEDQDTIVNVRSRCPPGEACKLYLQCKLKLRLSQQNIQSSELKETVKKCCHNGVTCEADQLKDYPLETNNIQHGSCITGPYQLTSDCSKPAYNSELRSDSSDDDVIFVSIKSRQNSLKRRSLSSHPGGKRRVLWYEKETKELGGHAGVGDTDSVSVTHSCCEITGSTKEIDPGIKSYVSCSEDRVPRIKNNLVKTPSAESSVHADVEMHSVPKQDISSLSPTHCVLKGDNSGKAGLSNSSVQEENPSSRPDHSGEEEIMDEISCFEHNVCPSQVESSTQVEQNHKKQSLSESFKDIQIHKPVDFFTSFRDLVEGLESLTSNSN